MVIHLTGSLHLCPVAVPSPRGCGAVVCRKGVDGKGRCEGYNNGGKEGHRGGYQGDTGVGGDRYRVVCL